MKESFDRWQHRVVFSFPGGGKINLAYKFYSFPASCSLSSLSLFFALQILALSMDHGQSVAGLVRESVGTLVDTLYHVLAPVMLAYFEISPPP